MEEECWRATSEPVRVPSRLPEGLRGLGISSPMATVISSSTVRYSVHPARCEKHHSNEDSL